MREEYGSIETAPDPQPRPEHPLYRQFIDDEEDSESLSDKARQRATQFFYLHELAHDELEKEWEIADWMGRGGINNAQRDDTTKTESKVGCTLFFQQIRAMAAQVLTVLRSDDMPWKYRAKLAARDSEEHRHYDEKADQWNLLAHWARKQDKWEQKISELLFQLYKYGNIPICYYWDYQTKKKHKRRIREDGEIEHYFEDVTVKNHPSMKILDLKDFYADRNISDMEQQECIIVAGFKSRDQVFQMVRDGEYDKEAVETIDDGDLWQGEDDTELQDSRFANKGEPGGYDYDSLLYRIFDVYMKLPIDPETGEWDEASNEPLIYWLTFVGPDIERGKLVRFTRNQDPDDEYPVQMIHALPDEGDDMYHLAPSQVIESSFRAVTFFINASIDRGKLRNDRPLIIDRDKIKENDLQFRQDKVWECDGDPRTAIHEFDLDNAEDQLVELAEYMEGKAKAALGTSDNVMGEAFGPRVSASDSLNAHQAAMKMVSVYVAYVLNQLLPLCGRKTMRFIQLYVDPRQVIEVTNGDLREFITPDDLDGEYDIECDVVHKYMDDEALKKHAEFLLVSLLQNPQVAEQTDFKALNERLFEIFKLDKNPKRFIKPDQDGDAKLLAKGVVSILMQGEWSQPRPDQKHEVYLQEAKMARAELIGYENEQDLVLENGALAVDAIEQLDRYIKMVETMTGQQATSQADRLYQEAPPGEQTPGQLEGNRQAAALGAATPQALGAPV